MALEVRSGDFDAFFAAPFQAYGSQSPHVSPLKGDLKRFLSPSNPLVSGAGEGALAFFTAHRDGRVVGRITAHEHGASNRLHSLRHGYFGYFDCVDYADVVAALMQAAETWCRARGLSEIAGNFNLTAMQQIGVVTDGFERAPYLDQMWSPPHIARLLAEILSNDLAYASGLNPAHDRLVLTLLIAAVVAVSIKVVGALLIRAMLIIPAAAARLIARGPEGMAAWATAIGVVAAIGGLYAARSFATPAGPSIICGAAALFCVASVLARLRA
jgi:hypothetical protein